jgi:serine/threonine protein phosphatase PrpC
MTAFAVGAATHVGQVRQVNQDNVLLAEDVFAVADGMGGHRGGEVASLVAVEALKENFVDRTTDALVEAVQSANTAIVDRARSDPDLRGMGTTICALASVHLEDGEDVLTIVNVGDSRAYLLKAGERELIQISEDHSLVQTLVRQGQLTATEAAVHPQRNILTRALGIDRQVLPDSFDLLPVKDDRYLLCSDGLFNEVDEDTMAEVLVRIADPQDAADDLVIKANESGGRDNITVLIVDIIDDAGHDKELEDQSDERRVMHAVYGLERMSDSAEQRLVDGAAAQSGATGRPLASGGKARRDLPRTPPQVVAQTRSRFTWRVVLFVLVFVGIFAAAGYAVQWVSTNSYYVIVDEGQVVIFQGRQGGLLWNQPSIVDRTATRVEDVAPQFRNDVQAGRMQTSLTEARDYVDRIRLPTTTTTTTTSTTSIVPNGGVNVDPGVTTAPADPSVPPAAP